MKKYEVKAEVSKDFGWEITAYGWDKIMLTFSTFGMASTASLETVDALIFWQELGAALDALQPGATGLRPLPDGDPNEVDAIDLQAQAYDKRKDCVKCAQ